MLNDVYNEKVDVERLAIVEESGVPTKKRDYQAHIIDLSCFIQPLADSITQDISTGFGKDYLMMCDNVDIIEGDRIIQDPDGTPVEYRVVGIKNYLPAMGIPGHMEIMIRAFRS